MCLSTRLTIVIIIVLHLGFTISDDSASPYYPIDDIAISCGSSENSTSLDGRDWIGDGGSKSILSPYPKGKSTSSRALHQYISADPVPYITARISRSQFTYTFHISPGQKFIRLHFYPFSYIGFEASKSIFSVKAGRYTLLRNFSASLTAEALGVKFFAKEFCVNIEDNQSLRIMFSPSENMYAFINGIEIVSMPTGLYYSRRGDSGAPVIGDNYRFFIDNRTALEMVHRLNIGGRFILPIEDLDMYRSWSEDRKYLLESSTVSVFTNTMIKYSNIRTYVAPMRVYQTAWSMGPTQKAYEMYNLTWKLPVDSGFRYLVRLHICDLEFGEIRSGQRDLVISINNQIVEIDEGVINWSSGNGCPVYRDFVLMMDGDRMEGKCEFIIALHLKPKHESGTRQNFALLNGLEIFKLSNPDNNLAGSNPGSMIRSLTSWTSKLRRLLLAFGGGNAIVAIVTLVLTLVNIIVYQLNHYGTNSGQKNMSSPWEEISCRRFSLMEIQLATNNFDDALVVGIGGFGKVYRGSIDHGSRTAAIKRLKLESKQGALEFWTEIVTLSMYRHVHLVSLIGYCDEGQEMLLVYEYMANGTLSDHLYNIRNKTGSGSGSGSGRSSLSWEERLRICIGAARGLDYLHSDGGAQHGLIHRDVKSSNILLDENWVAKISDFGLSKMNATNLSCTHISTNIKGTFGYLDPDYYMTRRLTSKSDVFAFGVVLFEVLCGRPAVDISLVEEQHSLFLWAQKCIREGKLDQIVDTSLREQISPESLKAFAEIANKCLLNRPNERPTMAEVVNGLEFELERRGSASLDTKEEDSNKQISPTSPTREENMCNGDQTIANEAHFSSTKVQKMKKRDNVSNRGPTWGWRWDSLWRRAKPSRVKTSPTPEISCQSFLLTEIQEATLPMPEVLCRSFSLMEIQHATHNFSRLIGNDPFSNVYFGYIDNLMSVAFKRLNENAIHEEVITYIKMEFQLQHVNLVPLIGYYYDQSEVVLVYDYMPNGRLYDHLHNNNGNDRLSWKQRLQICICAAQGLNYLHSGTKHKIIHRDVNSHNILLNNKWVAKITNLKCSKMVLASQSITYITTPVVGTIGYLDVEYSRTGWLTEKCDVFSFGVVLFESLSGRKALEPQDEEPYLYNWVKNRVIDEIIDPYMIRDISMYSARVFFEIAKKCLRVREYERPSMLDVLQGLELALELQESGDAIEEERIIGLAEDPEVHLGQLKRFSLRELQVASDNFSNKNILGRGGFGKVYKGLLADGTLVVVKRLKEERALAGELQFQTEVEMFSMAVHRNLLRLLGFCMTPTERLLVYPYMANGSVASCLRERPDSQPPLVWPIRKRIALGAARGLAYLHDDCDPKIIHRDVKAASILLDEKFEAVVGDFGLAKLMDYNDTHVSTAVRGAIGHMSPEYLATGKASEKTDVFGYGVMLLELITGQRAFDLARLANDDDVMLLDWVKGLLKEKKLEMLVDTNLQGNYIDKEVEQLIQVALLCTQASPMERPKMSEVVRMLEGDDGLAERWEEWQKEEFNPIHHPNADWIITDSSSNLCPDELSGPR